MQMFGPAHGWSEGGEDVLKKTRWCSSKGESNQFEVYPNDQSGSILSSKVSRDVLDFDP